jgi:hypothetical protein
MDGWGFDPWSGREMISFPHPSRLALGFTQHPSWWIPGLFPGDYAAGARFRPPLSLRLWVSPATPLHEPSWFVKGWRIPLSLRKMLKRNKMANGVPCDVVHTFCQGVIYFINVTGFTVKVYMSFHPYGHGMHVVLSVHFYRTTICLTALNWNPSIHFCGHFSYWRWLKLDKNIENMDKILFTPLSKVFRQLKRFWFNS